MRATGRRDSPTSRDEHVRLVASLVASVKLDPSLVGRIDANTSLLGDLALDSLEITGLMLQLEDELGREIDLAGVGPDTLRSVGALCTAVMGAP